MEFKKLINVHIKNIGKFKKMQHTNNLNMLTYQNNAEMEISAFKAKP